MKKLKVQINDSIMTTVAELINKLEKMPQDQYVLLNNNTNNSDVSVLFEKINVEKHEMHFPIDDPTKKQKFILLNQGGRRYYLEV